MKKLFIDFGHLITDRLVDDCRREGVEILHRSSDFVSDYKSAIAEFDAVAFYFSKRHTKFATLLGVLSSTKADNDKVQIIIDASDLTEEEQEVFDDIVDIVSDYTNVVITDDADDCRTFIRNFALKKDE